MTSDRKFAAVKTGRLGRLASMARAGMGTITSLTLGGSGGIEQAVTRLGELRGLGTKVGQMAGVLEAHLEPELRQKVGPMLAQLRASAAQSPYESIRAIITEDFGRPPEELFVTFEKEPFASASLGQVHRAEYPEGTQLAVKVQHPGIFEAFENDLINVAGIGRVATSFIMPDKASREFLDGVKSGFLQELDYVKEAENLQYFARLVSNDKILVVPNVINERSSKRVLSTTMITGVAVEAARHFALPVKQAQAAAVRRLVISSWVDHGVLYADTHPGNFLFNADGTLGVLDFGSVIRFDETQRQRFVQLKAAATQTIENFVEAVDHVYQVKNYDVAKAIAAVQWLGFGGLVRGDNIDDNRVRDIMAAAKIMRKTILGARFELPYFMPFVVRALVATNVLLATLHAGEGDVVSSLDVD